MINTKKTIIHYFFVIIFLFCNLFSYSQDYPFPEILKKMTKTISKRDVIYAVGISDPRMEDKILAKKVALNRALALVSLQNNAEISIVSDFFEYTDEDIASYQRMISKNNIQEMMKIYSKIYLDSANIEILNEEYNINGEYIVFLKYNIIPNKTPNFYVYADYYRNEYELYGAKYYFVKDVTLNTDLKINDTANKKTTYFYRIEN